MNFLLHLNFGIICEWTSLFLLFVLGLFSAFECLPISTIIYKDDTKYNIIKVNKSTNNNNGKNRINTSRKR